MKFKVFTDNKDAEKEVYFKLTQDSGGGVILFATNSVGEEIFDGNILRIREDGVIGLFSDINSSIGLKTEEGGFVKVEKKAVTDLY